MFLPVLFAWLHYLAVMFLSGGAVAQIYLLRLGPDADTVRAMVRADRFYGLGAALTLLTGLLRMPLPHGGKGLGFYLHSGAFHLAITVFGLTALLSLRPTLRYLSWNRALANGALPTPLQWTALRKLVHIQLTALALVALAMPLMARGVF
jgi:putative membrane protein